jgi:queuine/archaeosine tRNA-ribosyltransferase
MVSELPIILSVLMERFMIRRSLQQTQITQIFNNNFFLYLQNEEALSKERNLNTKMHEVLHKESGYQAISLCATL